MAKAPAIAAKKITIEISRPGGVCTLKEKNCKVKKGDKVRWRRKQTEACVVFEKQKDWPFADSYQKKIDFENGDFTDWFTVKNPQGSQFTGGYEAFCRPCDSLPPTGPTSGKIIIDP